MSLPLRPSLRGPAIALLGCALVAVIVASLLSGAATLSPLALWHALSGQAELLTPLDRSILFSIRLPRVVGGLLVGAVLGLGGVGMQGLFRNPLADPGLIGITGGAAFGAVIQLKFAAVFFSGIALFLGQLALPLFALIGALVATVLMHRTALVEGRVVVALMLLAGLGINALAGAGTGLTLFFADDDQLRQFTFWTLGSLGQVTWPRLLAALPFILPAFVLIPRHARSLNVLLLGESEAGHLGVDLIRLKRTLIFATAAGVGAAVSISGGIGFIGLIVPHLIRQSFGPDHRWLIPGATVFGAVLLLTADLLARTIAIPAELPVGIVTAVLGVPVFFSLIRHGRRMRIF